MTTVEQVAGAVHRDTDDVLAACDELGIVASSGASGLSGDEHRRLLDRFGVDGTALRAGSHTDDPRAAPPTAAGFEARAGALVAEARRVRTVSVRRITRVAVGAFLLVAVAVAVVVLGARSEDDGEAASPSAAGACVDWPASGSGGAPTPVPCDAPHDAEIVAVETLSEAGAFPGAGEVARLAERACAAATAEHVAAGLVAAYLAPTATTWATGDRTVTCLVEDPDGPRTAPVG